MTKTIKSPIITAVLVFLSFIARAQTNDSVLSMQSCIKLAFENNFKLKQVQLEVTKNKFQYKETLGLGLPQINGFGTIEDYFAIPVTMVPGEIFGQPGTTIPARLGTKYNSTLGIEAIQMIYNRTYLTSLQLFRKSCEIVDLNLQKGKEDLAYNIAQIYYLIQLTNLQISLLDSTLAAIQQVNSYTKQQYTNGLIRKTDMDRVAVSIGNMEAERENLVCIRDQQLNMLKYIIGIDCYKPLTISDSIELNSNLTSLEDSTFENQTDMQLLEQKKELAKLNIKHTRSNYYPSLTGYASYFYMAQSDKFNLFDNNDNWYKTAFVGIKLNIPIFRGNQTKNKLQQNILEFEQAEIAQSDLKNELNVNYINAMQKLNSNGTTALKLHDNMVLAENVFRITNDLYKQGLKSLTDVLNAQSEYNTARSAWLQALFQIRLSELELLKINGEIKKLFPNS